MRRLDWDCAIVGPGPGILGSASSLGHGGLAALTNSHAALSLGCPVALVPRLSSGDERERHRGLSHHTETVLALLLRPVRVPVPAGVSLPVGRRAGARDRARNRATTACAWTCRAWWSHIFRAACRPARWGARSTRTATSSSRRLAGGALLADMTRDKECS